MVYGLSFVEASNWKCHMDQGSRQNTDAEHLKKKDLTPKNLLQFLYHEIDI